VLEHTARSLDPGLKGLVILAYAWFKWGGRTYTVVSGHLGTPTVNNGIVTEEKDGSVTSLEARVGPLLDG
jgi:hypothetical protein